MAITDRGVEKKSEDLEGLRVAVGVCGGIAAVETVKVLRELRRHGALPQVFMTPSATRFVGKVALAWASEQEVVAEAEETVAYLQPFDFVLVAPMTLHTLAKFALGLCDSAVSLLVASHLGRKGRLLLVPTMNEQLAAHPLFPVYRERLESWGARFLEADREEGRLKLPDAEKIVAEVRRWCHSQ